MTRFRLSFGTLSRTWFVFLPVIWALLAGTEPPCLAQSTASPPPESTTAGKFEGTWYRVEGSGLKQAVQLRQTPDGKSWEMRFYWWVIGGFSFDTEWRSNADYTVKDFPAEVRFSFVKEKSNPNRLVFQWSRSQKGPRLTVITESGDLVLYRSGNGQTLVWVQDPLQISETVGEALTPDEEHSERTTKRVLIFMKAANRLIPLDEIPW